MTINEKAKLTELSVEKVAELAEAAGIDTGDKDRKLEVSEASTLGRVISMYLKAKSDPEDAAKKVRFWTQATRHMVQAGKERITFKGNVLVLDEKEDIETIVLVRSLRNIVGRYGIYEVMDEPYAEDSDESIWFSNMLEDIIFTGHNRERSKAGVKTVRSLFSPEELASMGDNGFEPRRLVMKALRNKSLKPVSNNG